MKIVILGDVGASASNVDAFCKADPELFSEKIRNKCGQADVVILNLEKPLTDYYNPIGKCPPDYIAPTKTINGIMLLNPTVATLANNHILDQGEKGLISTEKILEKNHIYHVGTGANINEARRPLIIEKNNKRIGIYACCEKEFSFATYNRPGANVFDPLNSLDDIADLRKKCDHLIVLFHGGMQDYPYPTPYQRKVCRKMCDKGADIVVCQHSHIIGCEERWNGSYIIYGQGNLLLDEKKDHNWYNGLIIEEILNNDECNINYIPTTVVNHHVVINENYGKDIINQFWNRSEEIKNEDIFQNKYDRLCESKLPNYLIKMSGKRRIIQRIINRLGLGKAYSECLYSISGRRRLLDYLYCDSHREAIEKGLEKKT